MNFDRDSALEARVRARLDLLTKPPGSLGRLEELALRFALIRGEEMPSPARKAIYVFCADHGVVSEGVSPYPQDVTRQMARNFVEGGAAISVLCRTLQIRPVIVDVGIASPPLPGVLDRKIARGTRNFAHEPAMTREQAQRALDIGEALAEEAAAQYDIVGLGEMGIGNTSSAAALLSVFSGLEAEKTVGPGTGLDSQGLQWKISVVERALRLHSAAKDDGIGALAAFGGFEIGAIAGFILGASRRRLPVVLDGFPCCAGAMVAQAIDSQALSTAICSHTSGEPGHRILLELLQQRPYLVLGMRLGEGTGAALCIGLLDSAVRLYREMATFSEAGIDGPQNSGEVR